MATAFGGQTFRLDFAARDISYEVRSWPASLLYEKLEPLLNAHEIELLDHTTLIEQLVSLIWRGAKITHEHGAHDDHCTALALAASVARHVMAEDNIVIPNLAALNQLSSHGFFAPIGGPTLGPAPGSGRREW